MSDTRKPIFDLVRNLVRRGLHQAEVDALDEALDRALGTSPNFLTQDRVPSVPSCGTDLRVSDIGVELVKRFEGCAKVRPDGLVEAYPDPATGGAPWTIGWGATRDGLHGFVDRDTVWTQQQCDERLVADLERHAADVRSALGDAPTTQGQFDALVSFHYNTGAIARATLTKRHNASDHTGAAAEFARWNRAAGRILKGLVRRRAAEAALYRS